MTWGLEVERHQLGATGPHGQRVVVGRVQPLSSGVNPGQLPPVVLQEALPSATGSQLLGLGLREGGHVAVTSPLRPDLWGGGGGGGGGSHQSADSSGSC